MLRFLNSSSSNQQEPLQNEGVGNKNVSAEIAEADITSSSDQTRTPSSVPITSTAISTSSLQLRQTTLGNKFRKLSSADNEKITNAIAYFIAVDFEPYSAVEGKGFRHLMSVVAPTFTIPSRTTFSERKVPILYEKTKKLIMTKICDIDFFGLTTDGWTAPNTHKFIALTCSYIDDDWVLNTHTLSCRDLNISNTGENIKQLILNELSDYKIDSKKIGAVTTDRGANVLLAVSLMGFESIPCFGHAIDTKMDEMLKLDFIAPTLQKIKSIYAVLAYSSNAKAFLSLCQAELNLPTNVMPSTSKTRWWSEITQFKFVVRFEMALYKFVTTYPDMDQSYLINPNDISRIKAVLLVMEPMEKYVTTLGSEKTVTASFIPPLIEKLTPIFDKFKFNDPVASFEIKKFFKSIKKFLYDLYIKDKSHIELATYLDPRFKGSKRQDLDSILKMEVNAIMAEKTEKSRNENVLPATAVVRKETRKTALEELFAEDDLHIINNAEDEINLFHIQTKIKVTECPLKWWKSRTTMFPNLNIVAKKYLCLPATSVLSERVFSDGKLVMPDSRFRLTDEHTEQLVFLSMNSDIVPKH